jgi:hypothetical protein
VKFHDLLTLLLAVIDAIVTFNSAVEFDNGNAITLKFFSAVLFVIVVLVMILRYAGKIKSKGLLALHTIYSAIRVQQHIFVWLQHPVRTENLEKILGWVLKDITLVTLKDISSILLWTLVVLIMYCRNE